jgi:two-component system chemotaxis sensor kinase CheA
MEARDSEFLKRLEATFRVEADEHLRAIDAGLIELEQGPAPERAAAIIETVFREAHSLKGAARSVSRKDIESVCQPMESVFSALKRQTIVLTPTLCDLLHRATDAVTRLVSSADAECAPADRARNQEMVRQLRQEAAGPAPPAEEAEPRPARSPSRGEPVREPAPADAHPEIRHGDAETTENRRVRSESIPSPDSVPCAEDSIPAPVTPPLGASTVRIRTARLDALLMQAEEMASFKLAAGQRLADLQEIHRSLLLWKTESAQWKKRSLKAGTPEADDWQARNEVHSNALESRVAAATRALEHDQRTVRRMVDEHLEAMKSAAMLPVATLVEAFPKIVRDLARDQQKEVELVIRGADIEIDKRILDELKDPFVHLLRNCVDHGIGKPGERAGRGKAPRGTITIAFNTRDNRQVEILVSDDGEGIDPNLVRAAAVKAGVLSDEAAGSLDEQATLSLIFLSGVSTSSIITDVSGRGLGLAIVREKAEMLGGSVSAESRAGTGTTFRLLLPMTLATFRGVLVREREQTFVLPTLNVERVLRAKPDSIKTVENRETIEVAGRVLPLVRLGDVLGLQSHGKTDRAARAGSAATDYLAVAVLTFGDQRIAFQVDEVLDEQQVMVKALGPQLRRARNIAGATVLGSGRVAPVLNVPDLMKSAVRSAAPARAAAEETPATAGRVLVADDSITARTLLKSILESAGYRVTTAVDGADAFAQVRSGDFDLVVSDVDMPRMSGFELTEKIRSDRKLGELPVVLVTALESREDRERGVDTGANAYIVKSSFDQSNLLEVIRRLI